MKPDRSRQWFVYHNEKEMGPFAESDMHVKLQSGEIDQTAYVFTEGMSDWALVSETPVLGEREPSLRGSDFSQNSKTRTSNSQIAPPPQVAPQTNPSETLPMDLDASQPSHVSQISQVSQI